MIERICNQSAYHEEQSILGIPLAYIDWLAEVDWAIWKMSEQGVGDFLTFDFDTLYAFGSSPEQAADTALLSATFSRFE